MKKTMWEKISGYIEENRKKKKWQKIVLCLAAIVVFGTVYALVLPAVTMESKTTCGLTEHTHTDECYSAGEESKELICTAESLNIHSHSGNCYDEEGNLICGYADYVVHEHDENCYDDNGELVCPLPEVTEHTHTESCYEGDSETPICGQQEVILHTHTDSCKQNGVYVCGMLETLEHQHNEDCFQITEGEKELICEQEEHTHSEECYEAQTEEDTETKAESTETEEEDTEAEMQTGQESKTEKEQGENAGENSSAETTTAVENQTGQDEETEKGTEADADEGTKENPYVYKDDTISLTVVLPEGSSVPKGSKLVVSRASMEEETTDALVEAALLANGMPMEIALYDISFETAEGEILPIEKSAALSAAFGEDVFEGTAENALIFCLPDKTTPTLIEDASLEWDENKKLSAVSFTATECYSFAAVTVSDDTGSLMSEPLPGTLLAEGTFGENDALTWTVTKDDAGVVTLTISGEGDMPDFAEPENQPWRDYRTGTNKANRIVIEDGITKIGQYAFKNFAASDVDIGQGVTSIGYQAFAYMQESGALTEIKIPGNVKTVDKAFQYSSRLQKVYLEEGTQSIDLDAFVGTAIGSSGNIIEIPASVTEVKGTGGHAAGFVVAEGNPYYYSDDYQALYKQGEDGDILVAYPTHGQAASYTVPDNVIQITASFRSNVTLSELTIPNTVTKSVITQAFRESNLVKVTFGDQVKLTDTTYLFNSCYYLEEVTLPDSVKSFNGNAFANCNSLRSITVGTDVTSIDESFAGCISLESFVYNAKNCDRIRTSFGEGLPIFDLVIGKDVDVLPGPKTVNNKQYGGFTEIAAHAQSITFEGPTYITVEEGALTDAPAPLSTLSGQIYVDENGIIYLYDTDSQTATLVYCPDGLTEVTIPEKILASDGTTECIVQRIEKYAFSTNTSLEELTVEDPSLITTIGERAFYGCTELWLIINKKTGDTATKVTEAKDLFSPVTIGRNAFENTGLIEDSQEDENLGSITEDNMDGVKNLTVDNGAGNTMILSVSSSVGTMEWQPEDGEIGGYHLLTGDTLTVTIGASNTDYNENIRYRVYFEITEESGSLSIKPGETYTYDDQVVTCYGTDDSSIVYLEFSAATGKTINVPVTALYPNVKSSGGGLRVWGMIYDQTDPEKPTLGEVIPAEDDQKIEAHWRTVPDTFTLSKTNGSQGKIALTGDGNRGAKLAADMKWSIFLTKGDQYSSYGKDYASLVEYVDTMELPEGINWSEEVINAALEGNIKRRGNNIYAGDLLMATLKPNSGIVISKVSSVYEGQLSLVYSVRKTGSNTEMPSNTIEMTMYADAFSVDLDKFTATEDSTITNRVTSRTYYNFSAPKASDAQATKEVQANDANIKLNKSTTETTYFGEDMTYTLQLYNDGTAEYPNPAADNTNRLTSIRLEDTLAKYTYIKAENIDKMFEEAKAHYSTPIIQIKNAQIAEQNKVLGIDGETSSYTTSANSDLDISTGADLEITQNDQGEVAVKVICDGTEKNYTGQTAEEALRKAGYAVNRDDQYTVIWQLPDGAEGFRLEGGEERLFYIYATAMDTFQLLTRDEPNEYLTDSTARLTNTAYVKETYADGSEKSPTGNKTAVNLVRREAYLGKTLKRNGVLQGTSFSAQDGDLLDYDLSFRHYGSGTYQDLPLVDDMYGVQYLLATVEDNPQLAEKGLDTYTDPETEVSYYKLSPGTYENVVVGVDDEGTKYTAALITVEESGSGSKADLGNGESESYTGLHTEIKWYYPELSGSGNYMLTVSYRALADTSLADGVNYSVGNMVWMNDKPGSRLYASLWGGGTIVDFDKNIVTKRGDVPSKDELDDDKYSLIGEGESVTYQLKLFNKGNASYTLNGSTLADALPNNGGIFQWTKDNVTIEYQADEGVTVEGIDNWKLSDKWGSAASSEGQQYILWPQDEEGNETAKIHFTGAQTVYLYVTLTFPKDGTSEAAWTHYCDAIAGGAIENTLYVYRYAVNVSHNLKETGKVLLQKGVYGNYYYAINENRYYATSNREYYSNRDNQNRAIAYYALLYNGDNKRMYLDTLYDVLPKGFTYKTLLADGSKLNGSTQNISSTVIVSGTADANSSFVSSLSSGISYRSATITATASDGEIQFKIMAGSGEKSVKYDEEQQRYYLDRNEAIVFGYLCDIGESQDTEDSAKNTIGMKYHDPQGSGVQALSENEHSFAGQTTSIYQDTNDGKCSVLKDSAKDSGLPVETGESWLESDVTVSRGTIMPGVTKSTVSYTDLDGGTYDYDGSVSPSDTVNWSAKFRNKGNYSITNYTITDTMPAPYVFEGDVKLTFYDSTNQKIGTERTLFTIGRRNENDNAVPLTVNGKAVTLSYGDTTTGTITVSGVSPAPTFTVKFEKDSDGNELMILSLENRHFSIVEGGWAELTYSSRNPSGNYRNTSYVNEVKLTPNVQKYTNISEGIRDVGENGEPDSVKNYSPVTVAFGSSTSSEKEVEEIGLPEGEENHAVASDMENNKILLNKTEGSFRYTLTVENKAQDAAMSKLVIIDNLPEEGDGSVFDKNVVRDSKFKVKLAENPDFKVSVIQKDEEGNEQETKLDSSQYSVEYNTKTEFAEEDWKEGSGSGWSNSKEGARAFRIIIKDNEGTLLPAGAIVKVRFLAEIDGEADPGEIAWNSFGYQYSMQQGTNVDLSSLSLPVGVKIPEIPTLQKTLIRQTKDGENESFAATEDMTFDFLIYEGEQISYDTIEDLLGALRTSRREYKRYSVTVKAGESSSEPLLLDGFNFEKGQEYHVVEIPGGNGFTQYSWGVLQKKEETFRYDPAESVSLTCLNRTYYEMPNSGGSGTAPYEALGIALIAGALFTMIHQRRKKESL